MRTAGGSGGGSGSGSSDENKRMARLRGVGEEGKREGIGGRSK